MGRLGQEVGFPEQVRGLERTCSPVCWLCLTLCSALGLARTMTTLATSTHVLSQTPTWQPAQLPLGEQYDSRILQCFVVCLSLSLSPSCLLLTHCPLVLHHQVFTGFIWQPAWIRCPPGWPGFFVLASSVITGATQRPQFPAVVVPRPGKLLGVVQMSSGHACLQVCGSILSSSSTPLETLKTKPKLWCDVLCLFVRPNLRSPGRHALERQVKVCFTDVLNFHNGNPHS